MKNNGTLYLIPNLLGEADISEALPPYVVEVVQQVKIFLVENEKSARKFLKLCNVLPPFEGITMLALDKHTSYEEKQQLIKQVKGHISGILSEAGCPAIADPGAELVLLAHENNIEIKPLVGPSSILLAIMGSGFNGQGFCFNGYLPVQPADRAKKLRELEAQSAQNAFTQSFIETPFRNEALLADILKACSGETYLSVAVDITLISQQIITKKIADWKIGEINLKGRPAVFSIWRKPKFTGKNKYGKGSKAFLS